MAGLFDFGSTEDPKQGTLSNMSPGQMGLLQAGLAMLSAPKYAPIGGGLVRSTGFGEQVAPGIAQGLNAMQQQKAYQQEQQQSNLEMLIKRMKAQREQQGFNEMDALKSSLAKLSPSDKQGIAKAYMDSGDAKTAVELMKQDRSGIPSGYNVNQQGQLDPMPLANGGSYEDVLLNRQIAGAQGRANIVDPMEKSRLDIALRNEKRAEEDQQFQRDNQKRQDARYAQSLLQNIPPVHKMAYVNNNASMQQIDDAIQAIKNNPGHLGLQNVLGDKANQRLDPEGVSVRAKLANIGSVNRHELSGAAVTASETPNLMPFIPSVTDNDEAAIKKLEQFKDNILTINSGIEQMYSDPSQYKNPIVKKSKGSTGEWSESESSKAIPENAKYEGTVSKFKISLNGQFKNQKQRDMLNDLIKSGNLKDISEAVNRGLIVESK